MACRSRDWSCSPQKLLEVDVALVRTAVADERARGEEVNADTVDNEPCVFLKGLHAAERAIAERLIIRARGSPPWPSIDLERARSWVEGKTLSLSAPRMPPQARGLFPIIPELRQVGQATAAEIAERLNQEGLQTTRRGPWKATNVWRLLAALMSWRLPTRL